MNHEHVAGMLMGMFNAGERPSRDQVVYLGRTLREMWTAKLSRDFPDLSIVVSFNHEDQDDVESYQITVFQAPETA